jgi:hypothetical protein
LGQTLAELPAEWVGPRSPPVYQFINFLLDTAERLPGVRVVRCCPFTFF